MIASLKSRIASWWRRFVCDWDMGDADTRAYVEALAYVDAAVLASGGRLP